jgi:tRNA (uracil-5-)-methyltransferase TRM9
MTQKTIDILNELNKKFYNETGSTVWNQSPNYYWEGWYQLTKFIKENTENNFKSALTNSDRFFIGKENSPLEGWQAKTDGVDSITTNVNFEIGDSEAASTAESTIKDAKEGLAVEYNQTYKVLDLGCGNARFANFLKSELDVETLNKMEYLGVDFSVNFMNRAQSNENKKFSTYELKEMDILKDLSQLETYKFDLIVIYGLIHHIPSLTARKEFFRDVKKLLSANGILVFTTWQYLDTPRLIKRVVNPENPNGLDIYNKLGISKTDLEDGDNVLDWVKKIFCLRYSHYFSQGETDSFIAENNFELIQNFVCDGRDSKRNKYFVCRELK